MVGIVDLYKQLSSPLVRLLETRPGHALQFLLRFLAEFRPAAALGASFITMLLNFHNASEEVRGAMLLTNYSKSAYPLKLVRLTSCLTSATQTEVGGWMWAVIP